MSKLDKSIKTQTKAYFFAMINRKEISVIKFKIDNLNKTMPLLIF